MGHGLAVGGLKDPILTLKIIILVGNFRIFREISDFEEPRVEIGVSDTPKIGFEQKDPGFERFITIQDDPQILSKKYYVREKLGRKGETRVPPPTCGLV